VAAWLGDWKVLCLFNRRPPRESGSWIFRGQKYQDVTGISSGNMN
jgi:hypothetical protein